MLCSTGGGSSLVLQQSRPDGRENMSIMSAILFRIDFALHAFNLIGPPSVLQQEFFASFLKQSHRKVNRTSNCFVN